MNFVLDDVASLLGVQDGQGTYKYANGSVYVGNFLQGTKNGFGVMSYSTGEVYRGEHRNNLPHGKGSYTYRSGGMHSHISLDSISPR